MAPKRMALRRDDHCTVCSTPLAAGMQAQWDPVARAVTCFSCAEATLPARSSTETVDASGEQPQPSAADPIEARPLEIEAGTPGASARAEHRRRQAKREQQIEQKWGTGRIGKVAKFLSDDPQTTRAWEEGAKGEERVAKILHEHLSDRAVLLHDRKVPRTRGNIDHLAIAPSGVWIIDAKKYKGKVEKRDVGGLFRSDVRLYVGGRDRTKAVAGLGWQAEAVRAALGNDEIPIHCALSFVGAEWPLFFAKPFQLDGVWVSWPVKLAELIAADGALEADTVEAVARSLASKLPAIPSA